VRHVDRRRRAAAPVQERHERADVGVNAGRMVVMQTCESQLQTQLASSLPVGQRPISLRRDAWPRSARRRCGIGRRCQIHPASASRGVARRAQWYRRSLRRCAAPAG
jgi:hypothetical protein